jgi:hypothetical protein
MTINGVLRAASPFACSMRRRISLNPAIRTGCGNVVAYGEASRAIPRRIAARIAGSGRGIGGMN